MGYYVNNTSNGSLGSSFDEKKQGLLDDGAVAIDEPTKFVENLICVINNGPFAAAGHAYSKNEMNIFRHDGSSRPKQWFVWDKVKEFAK